MNRGNCLTLGMLLTAVVTTSCSHQAPGKGRADIDLRLTDGGSPLIRYQGRIDRRIPGEASFDWPASGLEARFTGTAVGILFEDSGENDFAVWIDGRELPRIAARKGENRLVLADRLKPGEHTLRFVKSTESYQGVTRIKGILLEPGATLLPVTERTFRIQVFGDSYSAGYGTVAPNLDNGWHREHADACHAWPYLLAETLDADWTVTAASGRGVVRNWAEPGPRSAENLPAGAWRVLYNDTPFLLADTEPAPDLVIICLGHNDMSPGYELTEGEFKAAYKDFLADIRKRWPKVPVLCGSARVEPLSGWLKELVAEETAAGDAFLAWYTLNGPGPGEFGCDYHPNTKAQERFVREILPAVVKISGRKPVR